MTANNIIFFLLCLEAITISFNLAAIPAIVPSVASDFGILSFKAAKIIPFYMIPYGVGALLYAPLVKITDIKNIKLIALLFFGIFSLVCGFTRDWNILILSRVVVGISAASVIPLSLIIIGKIMPRNIRGRSVGMFFSTAFIASIVGVFLSGFIAWRWIFFLPAILAAAVFILIFVFFPIKFNQKEELSIDDFRIFKIAKVRRVFTYIFFLSLIYHASYNWLGVYFSQKHNFAQFQISTLLTFVGLSGALGQIIGGNLADKLGRAKTCFLGLFLLASAIILVSLNNSFALFAVILIIFGLGWTINHSSLSTILTDFPERLRSEAASLNSSLRFISGGIGVYISGIFMYRNFSLTFLSYGVILLVFALFTTRILREA